MLTWKIQMSVTLLITDAFVNDFFAVHDTKHLKFKVREFKSYSVFRIEVYIVFWHLKANFVRFLFT